MITPITAEIIREYFESVAEENHQDHGQGVGLADFQRSP